MITHKKLFAKSIAQWTAIVALIPLGIYVHQGFGYLFVAASWIMGIANLFIIGAGAIALFCNIKTSEFYKVLTDTVVGKSGTDKIYAEREQKPFDLAYLYGIVVYLIFNGHITLTALWILTIWGHTIVNAALQSFDDQIIDAI